MATLTVEEVRTFISDDPNSNYLLDGLEFSDARINLAMELAVSDYNSITPVTLITLGAFNDKAMLLYGTLANLFEGQAAMKTRNHLNYSDGGVSLPIEETMQLYLELARYYRMIFTDRAKSTKMQANLDGSGGTGGGWGGVSSDFIFNGYYW